MKKYIYLIGAIVVAAVSVLNGGTLVDAVQIATSPEKAQQACVDILTPPAKAEGESE